MILFRYSLCMEFMQYIFIIGIGWATAEKLSEEGVKTVSDLLRYPHDKLDTLCGVSQGHVMRQLCQGIDPSPVVSSGKPQVCIYSSVHFYANRLYS